MKNLVILSVVLAVVLVVGGCSNPQSSKINSGFDNFAVQWAEIINLKTTPAGCNVYVNDSSVGISPLEIRKQTPFRFNAHRPYTWKTVSINDVLVGTTHHTYDGPRSYSPFRYGRTVVPHTVEIRAEKEGYRSATKRFVLNGNDPQVRKFLENANMPSAFQGRILSPAEVSPREVIMNLEPLSDYSETGRWADTGVKKDLGIISIQIDDLKIIPTGDHTARISGKVVGATKRISIEQVRYTNYVHTGKKDSEYRTIEKDVDYLPTSVVLKNPFGPKSVFEIVGRGYFKGSFEIGEEHFFEKPRPRKYRKISEHPSIMVKVCDSSLASKRVIPDPAVARVMFPKVFDVGPNFSDAAIYARGRTCSVSLEAKDKATRREIMPTIKVSVVSGSSLRTLESELLNEFGDDKVGRILVRETLESLIKEGLLILGNAKEKTAQSLQFLAWVGSKYSISTVHPEYYYFKSSLEIEKSEPLHKLILLNEVGTKIRQETVVEGQGGNIADPD